MVAKNIEPLWLSFSHESLTQMNFTLKNYKFIGFTWNTLKATPKGLFIDHKTLLVLNKLYQYEQSPPQNKENSNPTRTPNRSRKRNCQIQHQSTRPGLVDQSQILRTPTLCWPNLVDYKLYQSTNPGDQSSTPCISQLLLCTDFFTRPFFDLRVFVYLHDVFMS